MVKVRLDSLVTRKGIVESREKARALILGGDIRVNGYTILKPGSLIDENTDISLVKRPSFVSRGGVKLDYALETFGLSAKNMVAVDIGASTGGFTDCLLKRGAGKVYAVDVGYGQLEYRLRVDPRVVVLERVNARYPLPISEKADIITIDVSFISTTKIIPSVINLLNRGGHLILLFKPQFELKKGEVDRGGVISNISFRIKALSRFVLWYISQGLHLLALVESPILGDKGNQEYLLLFEAGC